MFPINPPKALRATVVALYAADPGPDTVRGMLAAAGAVAERNGWTVADDARISDDCLLTREPQSRPGWDRIRTLVAQSRIHGIVVPDCGHIGFQWNQWEAEHRFLCRHGVFLTPVDSMLDTVLAGEHR
ncbi:hypothetical protein [Streptomyces sp. TLI_105]|uniref:hypothetical protein n=1 Tax=Streptomyces sp. TLI_105 TaxID=1881019 RepID=UPI00089D8ED2|nr:hypothetical protein [Streptomyces sp. TLI_105]SEE60283.1 hypothetical protein SAMN05428939_8090 [Streptomyces sp. TLI_105]